VERIAKLLAALIVNRMIAKDLAGTVELDVFQRRFL
jgi:hypothetical protein